RRRCRSRRSSPRSRRGRHRPTARSRHFRERPASSRRAWVRPAWFPGAGPQRRSAPRQERRVRPERRSAPRQGRWMQQRLWRPLPPEPRAQQTFRSWFGEPFRSWFGERGGGGGVLFPPHAGRPEGVEGRPPSPPPRRQDPPAPPAPRPPPADALAGIAERSAEHSIGILVRRMVALPGPLEGTTTQEVCGRFPRRDHAGPGPIRPPPFARSPLPRRSPELVSSVYHVFWLGSRDITLAKGRPCAKASRFAAIARKRRSQVPSVWAEAWRVITTFGSSWNANCEARTRSPEAGGYLYQTSIVAPRMRRSTSAV